MFKTTLFLSTLLAASLAQASDLPKEIIEQVDGTQVVTFLYDNDIAAAPAWQPAAGAPPVTVEAVARNVRDYADAHPELADATLDEIDLRPLPRHENNWHYVVVMNTHQNRQPKAHYFVMLMDGQVRPAIEEPASVR